MRLRDANVEDQLTHTLHSSSLNLLVMPKSSMKMYGDRAFGVAGSTLWITLPESVDSSETVDCFKKSLKPHLFKIAYGT